MAAVEDQQSAERMLFVVVAESNVTRYMSGTHYHNGQPMRHGDVIESDDDLQVLHPGKFSRVPDDTPVTPPRKGTSKPGAGTGRPTDEFLDPTLNPPAAAAAEEKPPEEPDRDEKVRPKSKRS